MVKVIIIKILSVYDSYFDYLVCFCNMLDIYKKIIELKEKNYEFFFNIK